MPPKPAGKRRRTARAKRTPKRRSKPARATTATSALITDAFRFLIDELGYEVVHAHDGDREVDVVFARPPRRVVVNVEVFSSISVMIHDAAHAGHALGLLAAVHDRCPDEVPRLDAIDPLADQLRVRADLLRRCAGDLLAGDATRAPRLRRFQAERRRADNQARFGTATGESPRFTTRPTLAALFEIPPTEARAYQAVWDYGYSCAEVAAFLGVTADDVQALLDRWDQR